MTLGRPGNSWPRRPGGGHGQRSGRRGLGYGASRRGILRCANDRGWGRSEALPTIVTAGCQARRHQSQQNQHRGGPPKPASRTAMPRCVPGHMSLLCVTPTSDLSSDRQAVEAIYAHWLKYSTSGTRPQSGYCRAMGMERGALCPVLGHGRPNGATRRNPAGFIDPGRIWLVGPRDRRRCPGWRPPTRIVGDEWPAPDSILRPIWS